MKSEFVVALALAVTPVSATADGVSSPDASSGSPCRSEELRNFRTVVFAKAAEPDTLWRLLTKVLCGFDDPADSAAVVLPYLPQPVRLVEETFTSEGNIEQVARRAPPKEVVGMLIPAREPGYADLRVHNRQSIRLQTNNDVCAMDMSAELRKRKWVVREVRTQCE